MAVSLVIMTLNAELYISRQLDSILSQTVVPEEIFIVDSQSDDATADIVREYMKQDGRIRWIDIARGDFDHGASRDWAYRRSSGEFVLFMTQDALPLDSRCVENLIRPFADLNVGAVCGRQVAYPQAVPSERLVREYNYPPNSRIWGAPDIPRLGIKSYFISNVCSAYRRTAYEAVGGFDYPIRTNEDMMIAAKLIHVGYSLAYCADASVYHSHNFTLKQQYNRNFSIGRVIVEYKDRLTGADYNSEGFQLVAHVLGGLIRQGKYLACAEFLVDCMARLAGNRMGAMSVQLRGRIHRRLGALWARATRCLRIDDTRKAQRQYPRWHNH